MRISAYLALGVLAGCAAPAPPIKYYSAPPNEPRALIKNAIAPTGSRRNTTTISVATDPVCKNGKLVWHDIARLFTIEAKEAFPSEYVAISAEKPILISYYEPISVHRSCSVVGEVTLEASKKYWITGGVDFKPSNIPLLKGDRQCVLSIVDAETGTPIPIKKIKRCTTLYRQSVKIWDADALILFTIKNLSCCVNISRQYNFNKGYSHESF